MTPEIMYKLTEKIVVYTPDKSIGHYTHQIGIYYRFDITDSMKYNKKEKLDNPMLHNLFFKN